MKRINFLFLVVILTACCLSGGCLINRNAGETTMVPTGTAVPVQTGTPVATGHAGSGNMSLQVPLNAGVYAIRMENNGTGPFAVELSNNDFYQQIIVGSGDIQATQLAGIPEPGMFWLNVTSNGTWDVTVERPGTNIPSLPPLNLSGNGDSVSGFFTLPEKTISFAMKNDGSGAFAVWLYNETGGFVFDPTGTYVQPLPNHIGAYHNAVDVAIPESGRYVINVMSDGSWSIGIS
jgi:hypothetical protein